MKQTTLRTKEKALRLRFNLKQVREEERLTQIMLVATVTNSGYESTRSYG